MLLSKELTNFVSHLTKPGKKGFLHFKKYQTHRSFKVFPDALQSEVWHSIEELNSDELVELI